MQLTEFDRNLLVVRPLSQRRHDLDISVVTKPDRNGRFMSDERLKMRRRADNSRKRERRGGLYIVVFHAIVDTAPTTYQTLTADFQAVSDYLKTKQDADLLEVITFSDYDNALVEWHRLEPFCLEKPAMATAKSISETSPYLHRAGLSAILNRKAPVGNRFNRPPRNAVQQID